MKPLIITGPSGVGKTSLLKKLFNKHKEKYELSVSHTTRKKRFNEVHGKDYYFIEMEKFKTMIKKNEFIEH